MVISKEKIYTLVSEAATNFIQFNQGVLDKNNSSEHHTLCMEKYHDFLISFKEPSTHISAKIGGTLRNILK